MEHIVNSASPDNVISADLSHRHQASAKVSTTKPITRVANEHSEQLREVAVVQKRHFIKVVLIIFCEEQNVEEGVIRNFLECKVSVLCEFCVENFVQRHS